jgi:hypothetical protein
MSARFLLAAFVLMWSAGASSAGDAVSNGDIARLRTITVVTAIGDEMRFAKEGVFSEHVFYSYPIADWDLNGKLADEVRHLLSPRYTVKRAADLPATFSQPFALSEMPKAAAARLRTLPPDPDTDAYLLITEVLNEDHVQSRYVHGLEMLHRAGAVDGTTQEYSAYAVALIDARSFRTLAWRERAEMPPSLAITAANDMWADSAAELTPEQRQTIRLYSTALMTGTLQETLSQMRLLY